MGQMCRNEGRMGKEVWWEGKGEWDGQDLECIEVVEVNGIAKTLENVQTAGMDGKGGRWA